MREIGRKLMEIVLDHSVPLLLLIAFFSRLPLLLGDQLLLDGDECIVALMAKHFIEGHSVPLYFYGQTYGFTLLEQTAVSISYLIFGVNEFAVNSGMLALWLLSVFFFFRFLQEITTKKEQLLILLIALGFALSPVYVVWAMKARGGYLTALLLSSFCSYFVFRKGFSFSYWEFFITGFLCYLVFESQLLWMFVLLPLLLVRFVKNYSWKRLLFWVFGFIFLIPLFYYQKTIAVDFWNPLVISWDFLWINNPKRLLYMLFAFLSGSYWYESYYHPNILTFIQAVLTGLVLLFLLLWSMTVLLTNLFVDKRFELGIKEASLLSILLFMIMSCFTNGVTPRYLLPILIPFLLLLMCFVRTRERKLFYHVGIASYLLLSAIGILLYQSVKVGAKQELLSLIEAIEEKEVAHVFTENGLLQWQIDFYSGERIIARSTDQFDRFQAYVQQVNNSYWKDTGNTVLVLNCSKIQEEIGAAEDKRVGRNCLFIAPSKKMLLEYEFELD